MATQIADVATRFQRDRTGHAPQAVTVVFGEDTVVITLHGALSAAEKVLAQTAPGAALVQEYHRQLFASSSEALQLEIRRITGIEVSEAAAEVEPATGTVIHAFTTGTMVQVFHLARRLSAANFEHVDSVPRPFPSSPVDVNRLSTSVDTAADSTPTAL
jgi:uncharacterized protein YbcI